MIEVVKDLKPLPGAKEFLDWLKPLVPRILLLTDRTCRSLKSYQCIPFFFQGVSVIPGPFQVVPTQRLQTCWEPCVYQTYWQQKHGHRASSWKLQDTFEEYAIPMFEQLGYPSVFCNSLVVDSDGFICDHILRLKDQKRALV